MFRNRAWRLGVITILAATLSTGGAQAAASQDLARVPASMLAALQRDLGLTAIQARTRLEQEATAANIEAQLIVELGDSFAGAYFDPHIGALVVGTTDTAKATTIRHAGARPRIMSRSFTTLHTIKARLDVAVHRVPQAVTGWYIDVYSNNIVISVHGASRDATTDAFLAEMHTDGLRVVTETMKPTPTAEVVGGHNIYFGSGSGCSLGFSAIRNVDGSKRMITAGHCTEGEATVRGYDGAHMGSVVSTVFDLEGDFGVSTVVDPWVQTAKIERYNGTFGSVSGSTEAPVGASVCRSGYATGYRCGTIQSRENVLIYPWRGSYRVVGGLTSSTACSGPGDSGGPVVSGTQAQGIHSGATVHACSYDGTSYYQPINEVLTKYGFRLVATA